MTRKHLQKHSKKSCAQGSHLGHEKLQFSAPDWIMCFVISHVYARLNITGSSGTCMEFSLHKRSFGNLTQSQWGSRIVLNSQKKILKLKKIFCTTLLEGTMALMSHINLTKSCLLASTWFPLNVPLPLIVQRHKVILKKQGSCPASMNCCRS